MSPHINHIASFTNPFIGLQSFVTEGTKGFHISLKDTDADEFVGVTIIDAELDRSLIKAKKLVKNY